MAAKKIEAAVDSRARKFRIRAGALRTALGDVAAVVEARNTVPILSHVVLSAGDGLLQIHATNLDIFATRECGTDDRQVNDAAWLAGIAPFAVAVPGKALLAILGKLDGDAMVTVEALDEACAAQGGPVQVTAGRARFRLNGLGSADLPTALPMASDHQFTMPATVLADALARVEHAISTEETRYYLNGVYWHPLGTELCMATTDGHRLAQLRMDAPDGAASFPALIVARQTVALLDKVLAAAAKTGEAAQVEVSATESGKMLCFSMPMADDGTLVVQAKTIDGTFPDYARVIPHDPPHKLTVARESLIDVIDRVSTLADGKSRAVKIELSDGTLRLSARSPEMGEASEDLPCVYEGDSIEWGFDARYFRDALKVIATDEVRLMLGDGAGPVRIEPVGSDAPALVQVVMPIRV